MSMNPEPFVPVTHDFFRVDALALAGRLLGLLIVETGVRAPEERVVLCIRETEAYLPRDPASHSVRGPTPRSAPMFSPGGHWYVYLSYGIHLLANVVSGPPGSGQAVLLRAAAVMAGTQTVAQRIGRIPPDGLVRGPGLLGAALGLSDAMESGRRIGGRIALAAPARTGCRGPGEIASSGSRVGISRGVEFPWRYWLGVSPPSGSSRPRMRSRSSAEK